MPVTMYIIRYIALENNTLHKFNHLHPTKAILYYIRCNPGTSNFEGKEKQFEFAGVRVIWVDCIFNLPFNYKKFTAFQQFSTKVQCKSNLS